MPLCRHCGTAVTLSEPIPRDAECEGCGRDLRACVQCRHYDPAYHNSCRETEADPVTDKDRRNFCEYFAFAVGPLPKAADPGRQSEARAKLDALFGGRPSAKPASDDARARLEALFGGGKPPGGSGQSPEKTPSQDEDE